MHEYAVYMRISEKRKKKVFQSDKGSEQGFADLSENEFNLDVWHSFFFVFSAPMGSECARQSRRSSIQHCVKFFLLCRPTAMSKKAWQRKMFKLFGIRIRIYKGK